MIPAAFDYVRADSVDEAIALLAEHGDDAKLLAGGHSLLPLMKLRLAHAVGARRRRPARATSPTSATRATTSRSARSPVITTSSTATCSREHVAAARARRPARSATRRCVTAARSAARSRTATPRPTSPRSCSRSAARSSRRGPAVSATIAADDFFAGLPRDRARARRGASPRSGCPRRTAPGWAFQKFNRRAQDWAIVGVAAVGGDAPRRRARQHGLDAAARRRRSRRALARRRVARQTPPRLAAEGTEPPSDLNASAGLPPAPRARARPACAHAVPTQGGGQ